MVSALSSSSGLSTANIASLFGSASAPSDTTVKVGATTSTGTTTGTPITGAGGGANAAKAIQAIITQIQVEKMQTTSQGKVSTLSLASVAVTYGATLKADSAQPINVSVTALNSVATATADNTTDAVGTLLSQVQAQEAQVEAAQGGLLMTKEEEVYGGHSTSNSVNWTANSVTLNTQAVENQGVELYQEENQLNGILDIDDTAQKFQAPSATLPPGESSPSPASTGNASSSSASSGASGSALYLEVSWQNSGSLSALEAKEQQLVSDFENGALPGQNGTTPENGAGFGYGRENGDEDETSYGIAGVMISHYDLAAVANSVDGSAGSAWMNADEKTVAMGGTVVFEQSYGGSEIMNIVIPLKSS